MGQGKWKIRKKLDAKKIKWWKCSQLKIDGGWNEKKWRVINMFVKKMEINGKLNQWKKIMGQNKTS